MQAIKYYKKAWGNKFGFKLKSTLCKCNFLNQAFLLSKSEHFIILVYGIIHKVTIFGTQCCEQNGWLNWDYLVAQDMPLSQELSVRKSDLQISAQCSFVVCPNMIFVSSPLELKKVNIIWTLLYQRYKVNRISVQPRVNPPTKVCLNGFPIRPVKLEWL